MEIYSHNTSFTPKSLAVCLKNKQAKKQLFIFIGMMAGGMLGGYCQ